MTLVPDPPVNPPALAGQLFEEHREMLVEQQDFSLFRRLAIAHLAMTSTPDSAAERPGSEAFFSQVLFELLSQVVRALGAGEAQAAAAIETYVAEVAPRALAAKVSPGDIAKLASEMGVTRHLTAPTLQALLNMPIWESAAVRSKRSTPSQRATFGSEHEPTSAIVERPNALNMLTRTAEPEPATATAPEYTAPPSADADGSMDPADDVIAAVDYEAILRSCLSARNRRRKVLVVVGLAATGKSFFVARLKKSLSRTYTVACQKGLPETGEQEIGRTKEVLHYLFDRIGKPKSPTNLDLYDIPGDQFVKLVREGFIARGDRDTVRLLYAILTFADGVVFIAPALQVLMQDTFAQKGDDLGLEAADRRERLKDIQTFISSLTWMIRVIGLLQEQVSTEYRALRRKKVGKEDARRRAADTAVESLLALSFENLQHQTPRASRLAIPALLLLSRADELRERLPRGQDTFDADPTYQLLLRNRAHLDGLAGRFDTFSVDFLTAAEGHRFGENFDPNKPSFGCKGLIENWFLPAIRHSRGDPISRWLRNPRIALRLRRWLDPAFADAWEREDPVRG